MSKPEIAVPDSIASKCARLAREILELSQHYDNVVSMVGEREHTIAELERKLEQLKGGKP